MKVWVKLLAGSILGILLGLLLPGDSPAISGVFAFLAELAVSMGRYTAVALILFSLTIGIYELRQDRAFWGLVLRTLLAIVCVSAAVISAGILAVSVFPPERIPILTEQHLGEMPLETGRFLLDMFPSNMLSSLSSNGGYVFPVCVFAFFLALGLSYDKNYSKTIITLVDSLSRIFYHIAVFFSEVLGLLVVILSAYWMIRYQAVLNAGIFSAVTKMFLALALVLGLVLLPLPLFLVKRYKTPWRVVYASLGTAISAFFSGDTYFCLPLFMQQSKENLGIRRRANTVVTILWTTFGRAGSAMVAAISLLVVIKSYSSLGVKTDDLVGIALNALFISFVLARNPGDGAFAALAALCADYGHGFETGYLILKPLAFYLVSVGAFLDIMIVSLGCFAIARLSGFQIDRDIKNFM